MALAGGAGTKITALSFCYGVSFRHLCNQSKDTRSSRAGLRGNDEAGLSRGGKERQNFDWRSSDFFFFSLTFLARLPFCSLSPLSFPAFRAEGGTARNEAARAVAAPRGGVAVVLCSSTSASTVSRSGGGREADEGLFSSLDGRQGQELLAKKKKRKTDFADITLPLVPRIPIRQSQAPRPLRLVATEARGINGGGSNEAAFASSSSSAAEAASTASIPTTTAAIRLPPSTAQNASAKVPSRDLPPAPIRRDAERIYSNMMASTSG